MIFVGSPSGFGTTVCDCHYKGPQCTHAKHQMHETHNMCTRRQLRFWWMQLVHVKNAHAHWATVATPDQLEWWCTRSEEDVKADMGEYSRKFEAIEGSWFAAAGVWSIERLFRWFEAAGCPAYSWDNICTEERMNWWQQQDKEGVKKDMTDWFNLLQNNCPCPNCNQQNVFNVMSTNACPSCGITRERIRVDKFYGINSKFSRKSPKKDPWFSQTAVDEWSHGPMDEQDEIGCSGGGTRKYCGKMYQYELGKQISALNKVMAAHDSSGCIGALFFSTKQASGPGPSGNLCNGECLVAECGVCQNSQIVLPGVGL